MWESDNVKTRRAARDISQERQIKQAVHPTGTAIAANARVRI